MTTRLVQLRNGGTRRVALVEEPLLRLIAEESVYSLALDALRSGARLSAAAREKATKEVLDYDAVYQGSSDWRILPAIDHPDELARCMISGTGLTHLGSARDRDAMHAALDKGDLDQLTDSMKIFRWGVERGRPAAGTAGVSPEWFYKGTGLALRAHLDSLEVPGYAEDGGEEAEIAGIYLVGPDGQPYRLGVAVGNEFSDHVFEKRNYLYLASSKLRSCAIGPELVVDADFESVPGEVSILRKGEMIWSKKICTGEGHMCHSLQNIEHHHFKFAQHRRPGDVHVHFLGADCLSFGDGIRLSSGDTMRIGFEGFGRALLNTVQRNQPTSSLICVKPLDWT